MENSIYDDYVALDSKIKALTEQKEQMRVAILEDMHNKGINKIDSSFASFAIQKRKSYTYPEHVLELEQQYKGAKAEAVENETATYEEKESLFVKPIKL